MEQERTVTDFVDVSSSVAILVEVEEVEGYGEVAREEESIGATSAELGEDASGGVEVADGVANDGNALGDLLEIRGRMIELMNDSVIRFRIPPQNGFKKCLFFDNNGTGCLARFRTEQELRVHVKNCLFGILKYCKSRVCNINYETVPIFHSLKTFSHHVGHSHQCPAFTSNEVNGMTALFHPSIWNVEENGYNLHQTARLLFKLKGTKVGVLIGGVVQSLDQQGHCLFTITPLMYNAENTKTDHFMRVEVTMKGRDNVPILPISGPDFNVHDPNPIAVCHAFPSTKEFLDAYSKVDQVISYDSRTIRQKSFPVKNQQGVFEGVTLDIKINVFKCVVQIGTELPHVPYSLTWTDLDLAAGVQASMDEAQDAYPSPVTCILLEQLRGQQDIMIEAIDTSMIENALITAFIDHVLKLGDRPKDKPKSISAWVLFPTVSSLRTSVQRWKQRAEKLQVSVCQMETFIPEMVKHIKRFGCDVLLTVPATVHSMLTSNDDALKDLLVHSVKYLYLPSHSKNCFPEHVPKLQAVLDDLRDSNIIRIGHVEHMHDEIKRHSCPPDDDDDDAGESNAIFYRKWNLFSLGDDPIAYAAGLTIETINVNGDHQLREKIISTINSRGIMRWLVIIMYNQLIETLGKSMDYHWKDVSRVRYVSQERELMANPCFWDSFKARPDAIFVGPKFLLDSVESYSCDGIILVAEPIYAAEKVQMRKIVELPNEQQKPVLLFKNIRIQKN